MAGCTVKRSLKKNPRLFCIYRLLTTVFNSASYSTISYLYMIPFHGYLLHENVDRGLHTTKADGCGCEGEYCVFNTTTHLQRIFSTGWAKDRKYHTNVRTMSTICNLCLSDPQRTMLLDNHNPTTILLHHNVFTSSWQQDFCS